MLALELVQLIQSRLKTQLATKIGDRVFILPSKEAIIASYASPFIGIFYNAPNAIKKDKGSYRWVHSVEVVIYVTVMKEEAALVGIPGVGAGATTHGLLQLVEDVYATLKDYRFDVAGEQPGKFYLADIASVSGVTSYVDLGTMEWSASISIEIQYGEQE